MLMIREVCYLFIRTFSHHAGSQAVSSRPCIGSPPHILQQQTIKLRQPILTPCLHGSRGGTCHMVKSVKSSLRSVHHYTQQQQPQLPKPLCSAPEIKR